MDLDVTMLWSYQSHIVSAKNRLLKRYDKCSLEPCKALWLNYSSGMGKEQYQAAISDQKRYNREIHNHYPIVPYGIRRVT